jgi:drug/metabolite transporter (DMT)-like permease
VFTIKQAYSKYLLALLLFGSNGIVASLISLSSYEIVFLRTLIGSLLLTVLFKASRQTFDLFKNRAHLFYLLISGMAMGASWMFLYEAYQQVGVSIASLAYYCGPVIVMVFSPFIFDERLTTPKIIGFFTVLIGICLINMQAVTADKTVWGLFCGGMSAIMYALMVIFNKKAVSITGLRNATLQLIVSFLTVAIFMGLRQGFVIDILPGDWLFVLILGLFNTGIGCYLYFSSINQLPVQSVAILGYLEPLSAVFFAVIFLGEQLTLLQLLGAGLVIGGAIFAERYSKK